MKIAIVGTGAMGSVYAGLLGKAGHEVWAIDIWQEHIDAIAGSGLAVSGASGSYVVDNLQVGRAPADAGSCDVWVIATKAADVDAAAAAVAPLLRARQRGHGLPERARSRASGWPGGSPKTTSSSASPRASGPPSRSRGTCTTKACG